MAPQELQSTESSWQPLGSIERRVLGVLVEKAKTTPDAYPLTVNAITTGCNQKSNRSPLMQLDSLDVENALEQLRRLGAVSEVHGSGRAPKYRHLVYEWLGTDKLESAVMAELLLRGEQTVGELRGRAARMGKIAGLADLRPILKSLMEKNLVQALTPAGRGQIVTHCLYLPEQQEKLNRNHGLDSSTIGSFSIADADIESSAAIPSASNTLQAESTVNECNNDFKTLQLEIESLKGAMRDLERKLQRLEQLLE